LRNTRFKLPVTLAEPGSFRVELHGFRVELGCCGAVLGV
jgi:hypothetical protein